jgi:hypothetical protein
MNVSRGIADQEEKLSEDSDLVGSGCPGSKTLAAWAMCVKRYEGRLQSGPAQRHCREAAAMLNC